MPTSRRNFLYLLLGSSIGAFSHPAFSLLSSTEPGTNATLATILANFLDDKGSARVVGVEYLRGHPAECDADWLANQIFSGDLHRRAEFTRAGAAERRALIESLIRKDFERGRIVQVRGWMLSQTEARLYAIAALA